MSLALANAPPIDSTSPAPNSTALFPRSAQNCLTPSTQLEMSAPRLPKNSPMPERMPPMKSAAAWNAPHIVSQAAITALRNPSLVFQR